MQTDEELYTNFLAPALADFEVVHKKMIEEFLAYRALVQNTQVFLTRDHPIFNVLERDASWPDIAICLRQMRPLDAYPRLSSLFMAINDYVYMALTEPYKYNNFVEQLFSQDRLEVTTSSPGREAGKRQEAISQIDEFVGLMQHSYSLLVEEFSKIKRLLEIPK